MKRAPEGSSREEIRGLVTLTGTADSFHRPARFAGLHDRNRLGCSDRLSRARWPPIARQAVRPDNFVGIDAQGIGERPRYTFVGCVLVLRLVRVLDTIDGRRRNARRIGQLLLRHTNALTSLAQRTGCSNKCVGHCQPSCSGAIQFVS